MIGSAGSSTDILAQAQILTLRGKQLAKEEKAAAAGQVDQAFPQATVPPAKAKEQPEPIRKATNAEERRR